MDKATETIRHKNIIKNKAFTLAEVLITLAIIGVVAALTIPTVIKTTDHQYISAYKKFYSLMVQFHARARFDNGGSMYGVFETNNWYQNYKVFQKYFASAHICIEGNTQYKQCFPDYTYENNPPLHVNNTTSFIMNNGMILIFDGASATCESNVNNELKEPIACIRVRADINGFKKPNKVGIDIYDIYILNDKIVPRGDPITTIGSIAGGVGTPWAAGYRILKTGTFRKK